MRTLAVALTLALATPAFAADKDEDKAKEVATAFLKGVKAKDLDAVMKTVDVPFAMNKTDKPIAKTEDLKALFEKLLAALEPGKIPTEGGTVITFAAFGQKGEKEKMMAEMLEKFGGKTAYLVLFETPQKRDLPIVVRIKDGQAKVVWIPK